MFSKIKSWYKKDPKKDKKEKPKMSNKDYERLGRRMEQVYVSGYSSIGRLMYMSFFKGIAYGVGIFIGGTIVVGIVVSVLVQFEEMPVIGPFVQKVNSSIEQASEGDLDQIREASEANQNQSN